MRWIFLPLIFTLLATNSAFGESLEACDGTDVSRKVERQANNWEQDSRRFGKAESVAKKISKRLAKGDLEGCELERIELALQRVNSRSSDPDTSIQALEQLIEAGETGTEGDPTGFIRNLAIRHVSSGQVEKLVPFVSKHLDQVSGTDRNRLMHALVIGLAATNDVEGAYVIAVDRVREFPEAFSLDSIQLLYAMASHLGLEEHKVQYAEFADQNFGGQYVLGALPLFEGDDLARLLERRINPIYELELKVPPKPSYPNQAANRGLNGTCEVFFDVNEDGRPQNVRAFCSHAAFVDESTRAVKKMRYEPFEVDGIRYAVPGFVYPLEYTIG